MEPIYAWVLFAILGGVCGLYVSVVGFVLTAVAIVLLLGLASPLVGGFFGLPTLVVTFVAMQVGYFATLVGSVLFRHFARMSAKDPRRIEEADAAAEATARGGGSNGLS